MADEKEKSSSGWWAFLFGAFPALLPLAGSGALGKEAEEAANNMLPVFAILAVILMAIFAILYLAL